MPPTNPSSVTTISSETGNKIEYGRAFRYEDADDIALILMTGDLETLREASHDSSRHATTSDAVEDIVATYIIHSFAPCADNVRQTLQDEGLADIDYEKVYKDAMSQARRWRRKNPNDSPPPCIEMLSKSSQRA